MEDAGADDGAVDAHISTGRDLFSVVREVFPRLSCGGTTMTWEWVLGNSMQSRLGRQNDGPVVGTGLMNLDLEKS